MKFRATPRVSGAVLIVDMSGTLKLGAGSAKFRGAIRKYLNEDHQRSLLEMD
ncbi:MAG: hypothetical protein WAM91_12890 [Candidatus Acidiferrales bacterium]